MALSTLSFTVTQVTTSNPLHNLNWAPIIEPRYNILLSPVDNSSLSGLEQPSKVTVVEGQCPLVLKRRSENGDMDVVRLEYLEKADNHKCQNGNEDKI